MAYTIGLTGNIACGKSTIGRILVDCGADYIDTDAVVHNLLAEDSPQARQILEQFGPEAAAPGGGINRAALGAIVFRDAEKLRALERILHPAVEAIVEQRMKLTSAPVLMIDGVKIVESGFADRMDALWVVTCSEEHQRARLAEKRGMQPLDIEARLRSQPSLESKLARADIVINNDGSLEDTERQVREAYSAVLKRLASA